MKASPQVLCLDDVTKLWENAVQTFDVAGIDPTLQLIYRLQRQPYSRGRSFKGKGKRTQSSLLEQEAFDLARATEESLASASGIRDGLAQVQPDNLRGSSLQGPNDLHDSLETPDENLSDDAALLWAMQQSLLDNHYQRSGSSSSESE